MPSAPDKGRGEDAIIALAARLSNVLQPATVSDILAESALPPDPLAPPAAFGCLGCGGLRELKQVPCSCGALSTRRIPELPGGPVVTQWKRFVLTNFAQLRAAWEVLPPLLCFSSLLSTSKWVTTFVDPKHRGKVKAGQYLSVPLHLAGTTWCFWSEGTSGRTGPANRLSLLQTDHVYAPVGPASHSGVVLRRSGSGGGDRKPGAESRAGAARRAGDGAGAGQ